MRIVIAFIILLPWISKAQNLTNSQIDSVLSIALSHSSVYSFISEEDTLIPVVTVFSDEWFDGPYQYNTCYSVDSSYRNYFSWENRRSWQKTKLNDSMTICFNIYRFWEKKDNFRKVILSFDNHSEFKNDVSTIGLKIICDNNPVPIDEEDILDIYYRRMTLRRDNDSNQWCVSDVLEIKQEIPRKAGEYYILASPHFR